VVAFQTKERLLRSGVVDRTMWNRLETRDYPLVAYRGLTLRQGSQGSAVVAVQRRLGLRPDGIFGLKTSTMVKVVQGRAKLAQTGVVSGWTWVAVESWKKA
jgi:peptidoglycan hydrolase-like protein with peptidoglycan-binding domain